MRIMATDLQGAALLPKLEERDLIALEAKYHFFSSLWLHDDS